MAQPYQMGNDGRQIAPMACAGHGRRHKAPTCTQPFVMTPYQAYCAELPRPPNHGFHQSDCLERSSFGTPHYRYVSTNALHIVGRSHTYV